jgi:hypothetical protein
MELSPGSPGLLLSNFPIFDCALYAARGLCSGSTVIAELLYALSFAQTTASIDISSFPPFGGLLNSGAKLSIGA